MKYRENNNERLSYFGVRLTSISLVFVHSHMTNSIKTLCNLSTLKQSLSSTCLTPRTLYPFRTKLPLVNTHLEIYSPKKPPLAFSFRTKQINIKQVTYSNNQLSLKNSRM